jgi:glutaconyl-CoA decarboxylase
MRKFRITVEGRSYNVVVEDLGGGVEVADPPRAAPAAPALTAPTPAPAPAAAPPAPSAAGAGSVVAPLGGVVDSIDVKLGSVIAVGEKVATIEAMKMKNEVRSQVAGKVTNIAVTVNQGVETGQVLMTVA